MFKWATAVIRFYTHTSHEAYYIKETLLAAGNLSNCTILRLLQESKFANVHRNGHRRLPSDHNRLPLLGGTTDYDMFLIFEPGLRAEKGVDSKLWNWYEWTKGISFYLRKLMTRLGEKDGLNHMCSFVTSIWPQVDHSRARKCGKVWLGVVGLKKCASYHMVRKWSVIFAS